MIVFVSMLVKVENQHIATSLEVETFIAERLAENSIGPIEIVGTGFLEDPVVPIKQIFLRKVIEEAQNYIEECEYEEGTRYWDQFNNDAEIVLNDFGYILIENFGPEPPNVRKKKRRPK